MLEFLTYYQKPDRYYHNLDHIKDCFKSYKEVRYLLKNPRTVWFAIWFHDCIYSTLPGAKNEELSATEARKYIKNHEEQKIITNLILVTKHSDLYPPMTTDECFMCDIDLNGLGSSLEKYIEYSENIRKEYSDYSDEDYRVGRLKFLNMFLEKANKNKLYYTAYFSEKNNAQAIQNIMMELEILNNGHKYTTKDYGVQPMSPLSPAQLEYYSKIDIKSE